MVSKKGMSAGILHDMGMDMMQDSMDVNEIKKIVANFRNAIFKTKDISPLIGLRDFPEGGCGDSSLLLGHHLNKLGYESLLYISGYKGDCSHAWIEMGNLIVDITADQFEEIDEEVVVTTSDKWHCEWIEDSRQVININDFDDNFRKKFLLAYNQIVLNLED